MADARAHARARASADVRGIPGPAIDLAAIERELASLWSMPHVAGLRDMDVIPTRTSVLNLVVFAASSALAERATRLISQLATNHPSRAIIFSVADDPSALAGEIDARVSTHCYALSGERFAPCFEQIVITTPPDVLEYLPSIIAPLVIPDLPTFIWWPGQPPLGDRRFVRVAQIADRLIIDSLDFTRCATNLPREANLCRRIGASCTMTDLNWARLAHWREMTAQCFDLPETRWGLDHIRHVEQSYGRANGQPANPAQALLYAGWLANRLGWRLVAAEREGADVWRFTTRDPRDRAISLTVRSRPVPREFNGYLLSTRLFVDDGARTERFQIARVGDDLRALKMTAGGEGDPRVEHAVHAPPPELRQLLVHELRRRDHDATFEDALQETVYFVEQLRHRGRA